VGRIYRRKVTLHTLVYGFNRSNIFLTDRNNQNLRGKALFYCHLAQGHEVNFDQVPGGSKWCDHMNSLLVCRDLATQPTINTHTSVSADAGGSQISGYDSACPEAHDV